MIALPLVLVIGLVAGLWLGYRWHKNTVRGELRQASYYKRHHLRRRGGTSMVPGADNYDIASFDGGRNWYAVQDSTVELVTMDDGSTGRIFDLKIVGEANLIYPGLVEHLEGMDALCAYARENGPLTLGGANAAAEVGLLKAAGFTVERK